MLNNFIKKTLNSNFPDSLKYYKKKVENEADSIVFFF